MKIAVFINNYNYEKYVGQAIHSVLNQTRPPDQLLIVDDGSTDSSVKVVESFLAENPKIKLIKKENGGQLSAFNAAISSIDAEIVTFLDSDDWYDENYLADIEAAFTEGYDFILASYRNVYARGEK